MDNRLEKSGYVKPYPQDALGGEIGLTSADIAKNLGVRAPNVRKKIKRGKYARSPMHKAISIILKNKTNGVEFTEYVFDEDAASYFMEHWNHRKHHLGNIYLLSVDTSKGEILKVGWSSDAKKRINDFYHNRCHIFEKKCPIRVEIDFHKLHSSYKRREWYLGEFTTMVSKVGKFIERY
jgi:Mn-dependent DtxR family transcriptional regulator